MFFYKIRVLLNRFLLQAKKTPAVLPYLFFSLVFVAVFGYFLSGVTETGITPFLSSEGFRSLFLPDTLLALSFSGKSAGVSLSEETLPEWVMTEENFDEMFPVKTEPSPEPIPSDRFPVVETTYKSTPEWLESVDGAAVKNEGDGEFSLSELAGRLPDFSLSEEGPQVLIVHTHATECYKPEGVDTYSADDSFRTVKTGENMISIGNVVAEKLEAAGYGVIHDLTLHDEPNFNTSYSSSNASIREYMEKYPSIKVVLDLHRDTLISSNGTKYRPVVDINGTRSAQVMFLMGSGNDTYRHENWRENLSFALNIQKVAAQKYPGLMRPILLQSSRFNQHLCTGAVLVEVGSCGNTHQEALSAAGYFSDCLVEVLGRLKG